jgi:hypothetical protein
MNSTRVIYDDAPAFIPVPAELQHRRVEAVFWPLEQPTFAYRAPAQPAPLSQLIGKAQGCFEDVAAVDAFIRAERDQWDR